jgi:hypothetical protein
MDQHPVPRQITTFEFKLIGFMTLHQFIYLVVFIPLGFLVFRIFPIPILNILLGLITAGAGVALAFFPIMGQPLDFWVRSLARRISSPTQYIYHKENTPIYFFQNLFFEADPHVIFAHVDSQEKLNQYLATKQAAQPQMAQTAARRQTINEALRQPFSLLKKQKHPAAVQTAPTQPTSQGVPKKPFIAGIVRNNKKIPLPGILIYIKDQKSSPIRLLKTNPHGIFATYSPLTPGDYTFEIKDPKGGFFFDTIKINTTGLADKPLEFYSKELL